MRSMMINTHTHTQYITRAFTMTRKHGTLSSRTQSRRYVRIITSHLKMVCCIHICRITCAPKKQTQPDVDMTKKMVARDEPLVMIQCICGVRMLPPADYY